MSGTMTEPDILKRLREADGGYFMRKMFTEAADEIERLRGELVSTTNRLTEERDEARREAVYQWLRGEAVAEGNYGGGKTADALYDRLRSEFPDRDAMYAVEPKWKANQ